jgi:peptide/nickel transport system substrate-binding protein
MNSNRVVSYIGLILTLVCIFAVLRPACADQSTLVVAVESPPKSMNPHSENGDATLGVMSNIFDSLMQREKTEGKLIPALAERYEHSDPLTWKFYLRRGVKFHNGNPFTAADVKYTLERITNPEVSQFVNDGKVIASIETPDDFTVIIKTKDPIPWFIDNMHQVFIMDKKSSESRSEGDIGVAPIGTGAYKVKEYVKGSHLKLEANPDYWEGAPPIKNVEMKFITEPSTRFAALASGQTELINGVPVEMIDKVQENKNLDVIRRPARRSIYLVVSNRPGTPTADLRVRKAMYMAINEDEIIQKLMKGQASPAAQIPDPPTVGYNPDIKRLPYDPQEASKLMKEAGFEKGFEITLAGPNDRYVMDRQICEAVAKYLAKIGINVNLDVKPKSIYFTEIMENKHDFYLMGWFDGAYSGARTFFRHIHTIDKEAGFGDWNGTRSSDSDIDQLLDKTGLIVDKDQYAKTLQEANKLAMDRVRVIPLHYQMDLYAVVKKSGLQFTPRPDQWFVFKEMAKKIN